LHFHPAGRRIILFRKLRGFVWAVSLPVVCSPGEFAEQGVGSRRGCTREMEQKGCEDRNRALRMNAFKGSSRISRWNVAVIWTRMRFNQI